MSKDLGEPLYEMTLTINETSDGTGSAGDAVKENGSGKVTQTGAAGEDVYGILAEDSPSDGNDVSIHIFGPVVANLGGSVTQGDIVETSSTGGQLAQNTNGKEVTGGSFTGTFAPGNPFALSDSGGTFDGYTFSSNEGAIFMR